MSERTLVTGFGPFGTIEENPSALLAEGCGRPFKILEVCFESASAWLDELHGDMFDRLLMIGVNGKATHMHVEMFAHNRIGNTPDVHGTMRPGFIRQDGAAILGATLWDGTALQGPEPLLGSRHLRMNFSAGEFLCNFLSYEALLRFPDKRVGFLHVPTFQTLEADDQGHILAAILAEIEAQS